ncbi:hypothetical protein [Desulfovibrio inopinatus]|uniref:hypothetical protein n=1 Tax=Desulfovibrio inopinatus TaxID=102109 RepID=UPI00041E29A1|nr:hypothetical protein [Desulfovibrio inopinatus]
MHAPNSALQNAQSKSTSLSRLFRNKVLLFALAVPMCVLVGSGAAFGLTAIFSPDDALKGAELARKFLIDGFQTSSSDESPIAPFHIGGYRTGMDAFSMALSPSAGQSLSSQADKLNALIAQNSRNGGGFFSSSSDWTNHGLLDPTLSLASRNQQNSPARSIYSGGGSSAGGGSTGNNTNDVDTSYFDDLNLFDSEPVTNDIEITDQETETPDTSPVPLPGSFLLTLFPLLGGCLLAKFQRCIAPSSHSSKNTM